ncbi:hypothetical protein C1H46_010387 [Malus baccata]|uniref:Uncharacterized protein n=1 Tax=Malus baccata TaxID=106549 RepID=A0A540MYZ1_MALBA|nr:hypothetical protein C1H46_010387 [Malus baccata]
MEAVDGYGRNHVNHDVIIVDQMSHWDLVLLAIANDLFFIKEIDGEREERMGESEEGMERNL